MNHKIIRNDTKFILYKEETANLKEDYIRYRKSTRLYFDRAMKKLWLMSPEGLKQQAYRCLPQKYHTPFITQESFQSGIFFKSEALWTLSNMNSKEDILNLCKLEIVKTGRIIQRVKDCGHFTDEAANKVFEVLYNQRIEEMCSLEKTMEEIRSGEIWGSREELNSLEEKLGLLKATIRPLKEIYFYETLEKQAKNAYINFLKAEILFWEDILFKAEKERYA